MKTIANRSDGEAVNVRLRYDQLLPAICARCGRAATTRIQYDFLKTPPKSKRSLSVREVGFFEVICRILAMDFGSKRSGGAGQSVKMSGAMIGRMLVGGALGGAIGGVAGAAIDAVVTDPLENRHLVRIPFCEEHQDFRRKTEIRNRWVIFCKLDAFLITVAALAAILFSVVPHKNGPVPAAGGWVPVVVFILLAWSLVMVSLFFFWRQQRIDLDRVVPLEFNAQYMVLGGVSPQFAAGVEGLAREETKDVDELLDRAMNKPKKNQGSMPDFLDGLQ